MTSADFDSALAAVHPSVSPAEMAYYEQLRQRFSGAA